MVCLSHCNNKVEWSVRWEFQYLSQSMPALWEEDGISWREFCINFTFWGIEHRASQKNPSTQLFHEGAPTMHLNAGEIALNIF